MGTATAMATVMAAPTYTAKSRARPSPTRAATGRPQVPRPSALHAALDLARHPILVSAMRRHPLPDGAQSLIRIAAGSEEAVDAAVAATGYDAGYIRQAAIF